MSGEGSGIGRRVGGAPRGEQAVAQIWNNCGGATAALWVWDNGDLPIWMTFDAIEALRLANLAVPVRLVARERDVRPKLAAMVSAVNRDKLPALAATVRDLVPDIWRLYQYSSRGDQNSGQQRHWLPDDESGRLVEKTADPAAPVPVATLTDAHTGGCLIVDSADNCRQAAGDK